MNNKNERKTTGNSISSKINQLNFGRNESNVKHIPKSARKPKKYNLTLFICEETGQVIV